MRRANCVHSRGPEAHVGGTQGPGLPPATRLARCRGAGGRREAPEREHGHRACETRQSCSEGREEDRVCALASHPPLTMADDPYLCRTERRSASQSPTSEADKTLPSAVGEQSDVDEPVRTVYLPLWKRSSYPCRSRKSPPPPPSLSSRRPRSRTRTRLASEHFALHRCGRLVLLYEQRRRSRHIL